MLIIPDLAKAIVEDKAKKIKRTPCTANRASSLGQAVPELGGCQRRGVYERTRWKDKELHDGRVQLIFDEGNNQEKTVYRDILNAGYEIIEAQTAYEWPEYQITGHIDGKLAVKDDKGNPVAIPVEIKSMHPNIYAMINCFDDFKIKSWHRSYMAQITLYMLMQGIDKAIFILKDKSSGQLKQIEVNLDYELGEACIRTAEAVNQHVENKTLPERIEDRDVCKNCPFKLICLPDMNFGTELKIADDPSLESKIDRHFELKDQQKEAKNLWETITDKCKATAKDKSGNYQELNVLLGRYHITGKADTKGSFRTKIVPVEKE